MQLSRFFTLAEMTKSETATRLGIANQPDAASLENLRALCSKVLDPLREAVGAPIKVNSGYRGPELNARIGGARKSQHMEGKAADIQSSAISVLELFKTVIRKGLPFDQVIYEAKTRTSKWVHVSHDPARARGAILLAAFDAEGRVSYRAITSEEALALPESAMRSASREALEFEEIPDEPEPESATPLESDLGVLAPAPRRAKAKMKLAKKKGSARHASTIGKKAKKKKRSPAPGPKAAAGSTMAQARGRARARHRSMRTR